MGRMTKPVVVVGSINMDLVARVERIPRPGETLTGTDFRTTPGGKGANQAVAAARLGWPTAMLGAVGRDVFGAALKANLEAAGVDAAAVSAVEGPSGVAPIWVADDGQNAIVVVPGANGHVTADAVEAERALLAAAGMVLLQLELPLGTVERTLALCAELGVPVMLDPAPAAALPESVWPRVAWLTPNETEAAFYLGGALAAEEAARRFHARGVRGVVLKRGAEGAYLSVAGGAAGWVQAFRVKAVDTVAAGDCFNGAFAVGLLEGREPLEAARFAAAAAAISVTRAGAQEAMPNRGEVERFLAERG
jgi:ribokinase